MASKECSGCHRELPLELFTKYKRNKDGTTRRCKECTNKRRFLRRQTPEGKAIWKRVWVKHETTAKRKEAHSRYDHSPKGAEAHSKYSRTDKGKASTKRCQCQRRTNIAILSTLTADEWNDIKKQYKQRCVYCNQMKPLTQDHIIPISKGGHHVKENIVPACQPCNSKKGSRPVLLQLLAGVKE